VPVANLSVRRYVSRMSERVNLADPDFEPSDAQLAELMRGAFAGVRPAHVEMLRKVRAEIEVARSRALRRLDDAEPVSGQS
jgi:hypothetical protein